MEKDGVSDEEDDYHYLKYRRAYIERMHDDEIITEREWLFGQKRPPIEFNNTAYEGGYKANDANM